MARWGDGKGRIDWEEVADISEQEYLKNFLDHLADHFAAASAYYGAHPELGDAWQDDYAEVDEMVTELQEALESGEVDFDFWEEMEICRASFGRMLARQGHQRWLALGPTNSRRLNQLVFLIENPSPNAGSDFMQLSGEILQLSDLERDEALIGWLSTVREEVTQGGALEDSRSERLVEIFDKLAVDGDWGRFDQSLDQPQSWMLTFISMLEAVAAGELDEMALFDERARFLDSLDETEAEFSKLPSDDRTTRPPFGRLRSCLLALESAMTSETLAQWSESFRRTWAEFEECRNNSLD